MEFDIDNKKINIFYKKNNEKSLPVIFINLYDEKGSYIWNECKDKILNNFILVCISNINWNDDLTPWENNQIFKNVAYKGFASEYLKFIENEVITKVEEYITNELNIEIKYYGMVGYSLAGLFSLYSAYKSDKFSRIASVSGSLWYPDFDKFIKENKISNSIDKIYLSLGNKEKISKNKYMSTVEEKTEYIYNILKENDNYSIIYELNE